jgi:hypothetical protein
VVPPKHVRYCVAGGQLILQQFLAQVLNNIDLYQTSVDTEVLTDRPPYLARVLPSWRIQHGVVIVGPTSASYESDEHQYRLVWEHRFYLKRAFDGTAYVTVR